MSATATVEQTDESRAWAPADGVDVPVSDAELAAAWRDDMDRRECCDVIYAARAAACKQAAEERARTRHVENQCKCQRGKRCRIGRREDAAALAAEYPAVYRPGMTRTDCEDEHRWREKDEAESAAADPEAVQQWRGVLLEHGRVPENVPAPAAAAADAAGRLLLAAGTVATVAAPPKAGKTWAALGLVRAVPKPGRVIWVAYERRGATARRAGPAGVPRKRVRILGRCCRGPCGPHAHRAGCLRGRGPGRPEEASRRRRVGNARHHVPPPPRALGCGAGDGAGR